MQTFLKSLFVVLQHLVPQHLLSRMVGWFAETSFGPVRSLFISSFIKIFKIDLSEAKESNPSAYPSFNAFFTRELKPEARPLCMDDDALLCPADGHISEIGSIEDGRLLQAKGREFKLEDLLGGDMEMSELFKGGKFATIYLSPRDYHRVHMPLDGKLRRMVHIPGDLFSVNSATTELVDRLFARNERVICLFDTEAGPMAMILVGAMICASIETSWAGLITPHKRQVRRVDYPSSVDPVDLKKGEEMGRFKLGSTVILLFGDAAVNWGDELATDSRVRMGERFGTLESAAGSLSAQAEHLQ